MSSMAEVACIHHFNGGFRMALETAHAFHLVQSVQVRLDGLGRSIGS
jgi:hypothetical protein